MKIVHLFIKKKKKKKKKKGKKENRTDMLK